jgi:hypothetical protein
VPSPDWHPRAALLPGPDTSPLRHTSRHHGSGSRRRARLNIGFLASRRSPGSSPSLLKSPAPAATAREGRPRVGQSLPALDTACGKQPHGQRHYSAFGLGVGSIRVDSLTRSGALPARSPPGGGHVDCPASAAASTSSSATTAPASLTDVGSGKDTFYGSALPGYGVL